MTKPSVLVCVGAWLVGDWLRGGGGGGVVWLVGRLEGGVEDSGGQGWG